MPPDSGRAALATVAVVVTAILFALFFLHRGTDVGHLHVLLGSLLHSSLRVSAFGVGGLARSAGGCVVGFLIALSWYGLGDFAARATTNESVAPGQGSRALGAASRCLYGALAWSLIWFALGIVHQYRPAVAIAALLVGIGLAVLARRPPPRVPSSPVTRYGRVARGAIGAVLALALISALAPPTARDALFYHFAIPREYVAIRGGDVVPGNMATYYPQLVEMQIVWAMLVGQPLGGQTAEAAASIAVFAFLPLLLLVVYGWAREQKLDPDWAALVVLVVAAIPTLYDVSSSGYVDHALTAYTALAVRAFARWWTTLDPAWTLPIAFAVGGTLSIKLTAIFFVLLLALLVLARTLGTPSGQEGMGRAAVGRVLATGVSGLALGTALAAPWYLRTWARTGSPVFPFYLDLWPGAARGWDAERSRLYREMLSLYGDAHTPLDYILTPLRLALAAQPDQPARYDGVLGFALLLGLPVLTWAVVSKRIGPDLRVTALIAGVMFATWLFASQQIRFLLPALPGLAVATIAAAAAVDAGFARLLRWLFTAAAAAGVVVILAWFADLDPVRVALGGETRRDFLARRLDYYPYYELINRDLSPAARVWLIDMRRDTYHLDRPYFSDFVFEDYTLAHYVRSATSAAELRARVRLDGITHLLVRHDVLLDDAHSTIVDDRQSREWNLAKLALMNDFFRKGTRLLRGDGKFWLIELSPGPDCPVRGRSCAGPVTSGCPSGAVSASALCPPLIANRPAHLSGYAVHNCTNLPRWPGTTLAAWRADRFA
jgi:hypothetical protein